MTSSISAIAFKDLRLLVRDRYGLFWVLAFPLATAFFFGSIFQGGGNQSKTKLAVVDLDQSPTSQQLIQRLRESASVNVILATAKSKTAPPEPLTPEKAEDLVRKGDVAAMLKIGKGFDNGSGMFFDLNQLELAADPSRAAQRGLLEGVVMQNVFMGFTQGFSDPKVGREQIAKARESLKDAKDLSMAQSAVLGVLFNSLDSLFAQQEADAKSGDAKSGLNNSPFANMKLNVRDVTDGDQIKPLSGYEITFPQALAWAFMGTVTSFAVSSVQERTQGTLLRLRVAPLSFAQILIGKGLACFLTMLGVSIFLLIVGKLLFGTRLGDPIKLGLALTCAAIAFVGLMTFLGQLGKTERAVAGSASAAGLLFAFLGGAAVPVAFMPEFMLNISNISPFKWLIMGIEGSIWRGYTYADLLAPCGILLAFGAVFYAAAVVASRYTQRA